MHHSYTIISNDNCVRPNVISCTAPVLHREHGTSAKYRLSVYEQWPPYVGYRLPCITPPKDIVPSSSMSFEHFHLESIHSKALVSTVTEKWTSKRNDLSQIRYLLNA